MDPFNLAVYGATGALGAQLLSALEGEALPINHLSPVAGPASAGKDVIWRGSEAPVIGPGEVDIDALDIAVLCVPASEAAVLRPELRRRGVLVIDPSDPRVGGEDLPIAWPGAQSKALESHPGAFAVPGAIASTAGPVLAAAARAGTLAAVDLVVLMGGSQAGREGIDALSKQTVALLSSRAPDGEALGGVLAFNVLPGSFHRNEDGDDSAVETAAARDIDSWAPGVPAERTRVTIMRVPVFSGLMIQMTLRFEGTGPGVEAFAAALGAETEVSPRADGPPLRDALDDTGVLVGLPRADDDGAIRITAASDPLERTANAIAHLIAQIGAEDLW